MTEKSILRIWLWPIVRCVETWIKCHNYLEVLCFCAVLTNFVFLSFFEAEQGFKFSYAFRWRLFCWPVHGTKRIDHIIGSLHILVMYTTISSNYECYVEHLIL